MAGPAPPNWVETPRVRCAVATAADDPAIRRLLRENPTPGSVSLTFEREPNYFLGTNLAGNEDQTILVFDADHLACVGRCSFRQRWVAGVSRRVGYLAELRLDSVPNGRFDLLRRGYQFFARLQREHPADIYFTSIAADNARARRFLESRTRGLPTYSFQSEFTTLLIPLPRRPRIATLSITPAAPEHVPDLLSLFKAHGHRHDLAVKWSEPPPGDLLLAFDRQRLIAAGSLWDQRPFRQTVIRNYSSALRLARPAINLLGRFGRIPPVGTTLNHAFLSPLAFAADHESLLPDFVAAMLPLAARRGLDFLTLGLPSNDPRIAPLRRRFTPRLYRSRIYQVSWNDAKLTPIPTASFPEVSLL